MLETRQLRLPATDRRPPRAVSERGYLRVGMPAIYQETDSFGMRFLTALEEVLDPIVAVLDSLPRLFDPAQAPEDVLDLMSAWLGLQHHEAIGAEHQRTLLARSGDIAAMRGTRAGLELALSLNFPGTPLRIEDNGVVSTDVTLDTLSTPTSTGFVVYCDAPLSEDRQQEIARFIQREKPAHVPFKLRVKAAKRAVEPGSEPEDREPPLLDGDE